MDLCAACQTIDIRDLLEAFHNTKYFLDPLLPGGSSNWSEYLKSTNYQPHQRNLSALRDAGESGCGLCAMIWARHCDHQFVHGTGDCTCDRYLGPVRFVMYQDWGHSFVRLAVLVSDSKRPGDLEVCEFADLEISTAKDGASIPQEDSHFLARVARDERPSDLRSDLSLAMGIEWLRRCVQDHVKCNQTQKEPVLLPTRVIDVGSTLLQPRLYISGDGETGEWVALSYCWGSDSPFMLTATSLNALRNEIPLSNFPPTLRDAVVVTRALGIRYLWIDALCIFQDDTNDWRTEASKMSTVYSNAVVTIAATSAESVADGFLATREPHFNCPFPWRRYNHSSNVPNTDIPRPRLPILLRSPVASRSEYYEETSRWATRGWTYQEQMVSRRLLSYTRERMIWHCRAGMAIEPSETIETASDATRIEVPDDSTDATKATYMAWYTLVERYTERQLKFDTDRLPAIMAFAKRFNAHLSDEYCAGLWRGDLLQGLLWGISTKFDGFGPPGSPLRRAWLRLLGYIELYYKFAESENKEVLLAISSDHRAPSWSWAGARCGVRLSWPVEFHNCTTTYLAKVVSVVVRSNPGDDFGCVEGGELVLEAPYRHIRLWLGSYSGSVSSPESLVLRALTRLGPLSSTRKLAQIVLTKPHFLASSLSSCSITVPNNDTRFTLIQIAKTDEVLYLLILQPLATDDGHSERPQPCYRRVGLLRLRPYECYSRGYKLVGEEMTARLEDAAYREVTRGEWPRARLVIV